MAPERAAVTYQPSQLQRGPLEREMVRRRLAPTEAAAFMRLERARVARALYLEAFVAAKAFDRIEWFEKPGNDVLDSVGTEPLSVELAGRALRIDGVEDGSLGELIARLEDLATARAWVHDANLEIALKRRLIRAVCARHGMRA